MANTQSIIVYRNPLEAQIWESGIMFPIIVAMVLTVVVSVSVAYIFKKSKYAANASIISGAITFGAVLYFMC